jgi:IS605 OrfB family transposase
LVVVERLKDIKKGKQANRRKEFRKTLGNWNYRELLDIIQMRCEENRVSFRSVDPYKTSQQCPVPACSHTERGNRVGENFKCLRCGYSDQADLVGSLNILTRFISGRYGAAFQT